MVREIMRYTRRAHEITQLENIALMPREITCPVATPLDITRGSILRYVKSRAVLTMYGREIMF